MTSATPLLPSGFDTLSLQRRRRLASTGLRSLWVTPVRVRVPALASTISASCEGRSERAEGSPVALAACFGRGLLPPCYPPGSASAVDFEALDVLALDGEGA